MTVIIMTMQQRWAPVATLCRELEAFFRCPVHANLYLTPEGAQGFDAHFDTHEVFVLQLEGAKQWRLFGSPRPLPLVDERFDVPKDQLGPPREVRLEAGDLLYIPRGFVHEAFTSEQASLHLTVGVNVYRWADLLGEALAAAHAGRPAVPRSDCRVRSWGPSGPAGPCASGSPSWSRRWPPVADLGPGRPGSWATSSLASCCPCPAIGSPLPTDGESVELDTVLEKMPGLIGRVVSPGRLGLPSSTPAGKSAGRSRSPRRFGSRPRPTDSLVRDLPDDLSDDAKLVLARRLVRERLFRIAGACSGRIGVRARDGRREMTGNTGRMVCDVLTLYARGSQAPHRAGPLGPPARSNSEERTVTDVQKFQEKQWGLIVARSLG